MALRLLTVAVACLACADAFSSSALASLSPSARTPSVRGARPATSSLRMQEPGTPSGLATSDGKYDAKRFYVRPDRLADLALCGIGLPLALGFGAFAEGFSVKIEKDVEGEYAVLKGAGYMLKETSEVAAYPRPAKPIELYEFQGCPFCAKVRYAAALLDLDILFKPCPRESTVNRPFVIGKGGKSQFPYMIDPNTGTEMYESADIIRYLYKNYGPGEDKAPGLLTGPVMTFGAAFSLIPRSGKGSKKSEGAMDKPPAKPLTVWGYEASPFSKVVREALNELELDHVWRSCARGSPKRQVLFDQTGGTMQLPYLEDDNTGTRMFESAEIVDYLRRTYAK
mmetsp:Transcript_30099/g.76273  ORF Transcript_30099/g.76273 Transcript_30099/m.76273 type:complete len:339 (-) Transcript_30099:267-1283(-)